MAELYCCQGGGALRASAIFNEYWKFAYRRQEVFCKKYDAGVGSRILIGDPIIDTYKFTNCYRVLDRVSQYLVKNVIYSGKYSPEDTFLRVILFKTFNRIETWECIESALGNICVQSFDVDLISTLLEKQILRGNRIYSAAYIMPSGVSTYGRVRKHENNLILIRQMIESHLGETIWECKTLKEMYETLLSYPMIGRFLAMQYSVDLAYSEHTDVEESEFIVAGPGAVRGIQKCFDSIGGMSYSEVIQYMTDNQEYFFEELELNFRYLRGRRLQLIDCQNLFCEFDKYCRVAFPHVVVGNKRIKQRYNPRAEAIEYFLPPKWAATI